MELQLKAKHFGGNFVDDCAIQRALKEIFPNAEVCENLDEALVDEATYKHEWYGKADYSEDAIKSLSKQPEDVIRTIILK